MNIGDVLDHMPIEKEKMLKNWSHVCAKQARSLPSPMNTGRDVNFPQGCKKLICKIGSG